MNIRELHYGFKLGFNKIDSNQNHNLEIPEIDFILNQACSTFVNLVMFPRDYNSVGFEVTQRSIDDIRPLVKEDTELKVNEDKSITLPSDYWHFVKAYAKASRGGCSRKLRMFNQQHDDLFQENDIYKSDFDWETLNFTFNSKGLQLYFDGFNVDEVYLTYVMKHPYIHNAQDYESGEYTSLNGETLTGSQKCLLTDDACLDIINLAVFLASSYVQDSGYNIHKEKLTINKTI